MRAFAPGKLVVASHNPGKVREIAALLEPFKIETISAAALELDEPEETGTTFAENAALKAQAAARASGLMALADDSGLCVDALDGAPGLFSARWAGESKDFTMAMGLIEDELHKAGAIAPEQRRAHFICVLCLAWPDGHQELFEGTVDGTMVWPPRGPHGFGYDPVFQPLGHGITFGEMDPEAKHAMSHRAAAFAKLQNALK
jgi:XTP/dITP diphosphohydrolase